MLTFNGKKFAKTEQEFTGSLFEHGSTCVGYYRVNRKTITLLDHNKNKVGVVANGVLGKATKQDNGKWWYSYGDIDIVGRYESVSERGRDIAAAESLLRSK